MRKTGKYEKTSYGGETVSAFVPHPLPPSEPPLQMGTELLALLKRAEMGLSRLELAGNMVPSLEWFIYAYVRKEAVVSSQIEGTQCTLIDLLAFEAAATADAAEDTADIREVCNYLDALSHARERLASPKGLPLSMRLLNETHGLLMRGVRGSDKHPGEIRKTQNWIGGTRPGNAAYVPPPPHQLAILLSQLEEFIHQPGSTHPLVAAALLHAQFETIHPYLDGNGRIGRLLITLLLDHWGLLSSPLLYLSLFFKRHREEYYRHLSAVRLEGDFEGWVTFFLEGVETIANEATDSAKEIFSLINQDRKRVLASQSSTVMTARLFEQLPAHPIVSIAQVSQLIVTTKPTANKAVSALLEAGVLVESTGRKRDQVFHYSAYLDLLRVGTEVEA